MTTAAPPTTLLLISPVETDAGRYETSLGGVAPGGYEIARAATLAEAQAYLEHRDPDGAIVDIEAFGADGLDIIEVLGRHAPLVALVGLTGRADDEIGVATVHAGAIDLLAKATLNGKVLDASIRHAIIAKHLASLLAEARAELLHQELHDPLTGLPNRRLLMDRLHQALVRLGRVNSIVAVIHLDIDRFRLINDTLGHEVGDELLAITATRLKDFIRPEDTLARLDGDEFIVLCEGLSDQIEAVAIADRICSATAEPIVRAGGELVVSVSAGIALATSTSVDGDELVRDAQVATARAKVAGRTRSAVFAETMRTGSVGRLDTETTLRHSIANGDLRVHYQPIVDLVNGQVLGHEALVRWAHPTRGLLGPEEFIAIAEETGLIIPLGAWVLREACLQAKRFQTRDPRWPRLMMSVNLSGAQLGQSDLVELVSSALRDADLISEDLQLEMTESVLMDDAPTTIGVLQTLSDLGVQLSIDDFGTGYSSLAYLRRFPVDVLKIDRTFVDGLGKDLEDSAIVAAVVNLADTLGFATIAEGVETELQRDCLVGLGCSRAQGYLFAPPVDAAHAEIALDHATGAVGR